MALGLSSKQHKVEIRRYAKIVRERARETAAAIRAGRCYGAYEKLWETENILGGLESHYVSIADSAQRKSDLDVTVQARRDVLHARNLFGSKCVK
jgi:hypothetical protein